MAITDYTTLSAAIKSYCARSDSTFSAQIPNFVGLAEARIYDGYNPDELGDPLQSPPLRTKSMEASGTLTATAGVATLPSNYLSMRALYRAGDTAGITYLPPERAEVTGALTPAGWPLYYTITANQLRLVPAWSGTLSAHYYKRFSDLSPDAPTNELLEVHGYIYLEACLIEAFSFLQAGDLATGHASKLRGLVRGANRGASALRYSGPKRVVPRRAIP